MWQRIRCVLVHYSFEDVTFTPAYKHAVYLSHGLELWAKTVHGANFSIKLSMGSRLNAEGDLCIGLFVDQHRLHRINFTWINEGFANVDSPIIPFIARNQGRWRKDTEPLQKFEDAFPQNSPMYFCYSAMQGVARAVNAVQTLNVNSSRQVVCDLENIKTFVTSYDVFWEIMGGSKLSSGLYSLPVPFNMKPLSAVAAKHRKRAAGRRVLWLEIDESAKSVLQAHMILRPSLRPKTGLDRYARTTLDS